MEIKAMEKIMRTSIGRDEKAGRNLIVTGAGRLKWLEEQMINTNCDVIENGDKKEQMEVYLKHQGEIDFTLFLIEPLSLSEVFYSYPKIKTVIITSDPEKYRQEYNIYWFNDYTMDDNLVIE